MIFMNNIEKKNRSWKCIPNLQNLLGPFLIVHCPTYHDQFAFMNKVIVYNHCLPNEFRFLFSPITELRFPLHRTSFCIAPNPITDCIIYQQILLRLGTVHSTSAERIGKLAIHRILQIEMPDNCFKPSVYVSEAYVLFSIVFY